MIRALVLIVIALLMLIAWLASEEARTDLPVVQADFRRCVNVPSPPLLKPRRRVNGVRQPSELS